jgi:hypothetical protein
MRLSIAVVFIVASTGAAFAPNGQWGIQSRCAAKGPLFSTVEADTVEVAAEVNGAAPAAGLSAAEINSRLEKQLEKLNAKDSSSPQLSKEVSNKISRMVVAPSPGLSLI